MICSPVSGSRCTSSVGSSSESRRIAVAAFSSSPLDLGSYANAITGAGRSSAANRTGLSFAASTSPARVSRSFGTAPMSPGPSSSIGCISLPSGAASWPMRSFSRRVTFWAWESEARTPETTRSKLIRPV